MWRLWFSDKGQKRDNRLGAEEPEQGERKWRVVGGLEGRKANAKAKGNFERARPPTGFS